MARGALWDQNGDRHGYGQGVAQLQQGELAHMVERSLSMREVPGSIPGFSNVCILLFPEGRDPGEKWKRPFFQTAVLSALVPGVQLGLSSARTLFFSFDRASPFFSYQSTDFFLSSLLLPKLSGAENIFRCSCSFSQSARHRRLGIHLRLQILQPLHRPLAVKMASSKVDKNGHFSIADFPQFLLESGAKIIAPQERTRT